MILGVIAKFAALKSGVISKMNEIKSAFTNAWNNIISSALSFGGRLISSIVSSINGALSGARGALSGFVSLGNSIITNIITGLNNSKIALMNYLKNIIASLVNGLFSGGTAPGTGGLSPDERNATGTGGWRTVPPGYNNDNYLVGLTSGEIFNVKNKSQQSGMGGGGSNRTANNYYNAHITVYQGKTDAARNMRGLT